MPGGRNGESLCTYGCPPGYTDPIQYQSGNPYGTSHVTGDGPPGEVALQAARHQARRAVETAAALKAGFAA